MIRFYVGLHQPSDAKHFDRAFISVNRLRKRKSGFEVRDWIMDSGAFTEISTYGRYRHDVSEYAAEIRRWAGNGNLEAAVAQDWMCEPFIIAKTGLSVEIHQQLTIERYDALLAADLPVRILPVLQGFDPADYQRHVRMYGARLTKGMWVGVGSICKRNSSPVDVANVLAAVMQVRPDLRLHGFGLKKTSLLHEGIRAMLATADSMAWSDRARIEAHAVIRRLQKELGRRVLPSEARSIYVDRGLTPPPNPNDWRVAKSFEVIINDTTAVCPQPWQMGFDFGAAA